MNGPAGIRPPLLGNGHFLTSEQEVAGGRALCIRERRERARVEDPAACLAGPRPEINDLIRCADHVRIVFHHHDRVSPVTEAVQDGDQAADLARMKAGGRLVQHVEGVNQPG